MLLQNRLDYCEKDHSSLNMCTVDNEPVQVSKYQEARIAFGRTTASPSVQSEVVHIPIYSALCAVKNRSTVLPFAVAILSSCCLAFVTRQDATIVHRSIFLTRLDK